MRLYLLACISTASKPMRSSKFLATLFFLVATLAFLSDATPTLLEHAPFTTTRLAHHWAQLSPKTLSSLQDYTSNHLPQKISQIFQNSFLQLPTSLVFGMIGLIFAFLGRRRHTVNVFIN